MIGFLSCLLYGFAAQYPTKFHWFAIIFANAGQYFSFAAAGVVAMTYPLDSYPKRAGPVLVLVCALRGFIAFGLTYSVVPLVDHYGYATVWGIYAALTAGLGLFGIFFFLTGKKIRHFTQKWAE